MFATHATAIRAMVAPGTPGWVDRAAAVVMTAAATILTPTLQVLPCIERMKRDGASAKHLNFAARGLCWRGIMAGEHVGPLERAYAAMLAGTPDHAQVALAEIPGIGLPKSGFILQMLFGVGGCIDSENEQLYSKLLGETIKAGTLSKTGTYQARLATVRRYQALVNRLCDGDSAAMWDRWCAHVASEAPKTAGVVTPEQISALHPVWVREMHVALWGVPMAAPKRGRRAVA